MLHIKLPEAGDIGNSVTNSCLFIYFQLEVGDTIDVIHSRKDDKLLVQRVKVIKVSKRLTKSGKPIVILRVWRKQFEVNSPGGS
jgi:hypothetical protein